MKNAYFSLKDAKRLRVYSACLQEFAAHDYETASLDAICRMADISKGGLYEYISTKEELYLYVVETSVTGLYDFLVSGVPPVLSDDILERFRVVSATAIAFYLQHPACVELLERTNRLPDGELATKVSTIFDRQFDRLFGGLPAHNLAFALEKLLELVKWLLAKTRADFLRALRMGADPDSVRQTYIDEWDFMLAILADGIYQ